ncbi:MAG: hypothetical protein R3A45_07820 [Bdellovibrionota bacterium]
MVKSFVLYRSITGVYFSFRCIILLSLGTLIFLTPTVFAQSKITISVKDGSSFTNTQIQFFQDIADVLALAEAGIKEIELSHLEEDDGKNFDITRGYFYFFYQSTLRIGVPDDFFDKAATQKSKQFDFDFEFMLLQKNLTTANWRKLIENKFYIALIDRMSGIQYADHGYFTKKDLRYIYQSLRVMYFFLDRIGKADKVVISKIKKFANEYLDDEGEKVLMQTVYTDGRTEIDISAFYDLHPLNNGFQASFDHELGHPIFDKVYSKNQQLMYLKKHWKHIDSPALEQTGREFISDYAEKRNCSETTGKCYPSEDFPEHFSAYLHQSKKLRIRCPSKYKFLRDSFFSGYASKKMALKNFSVSVDTGSEPIIYPPSITDLQYKFFYDDEFKTAPHKIMIEKLLHQSQNNTHVLNKINFVFINEHRHLFDYSLYPKIKKPYREDGPEYGFIDGKNHIAALKKHELYALVPKGEKANGTYFLYRIVVIDNYGNKEIYTRDLVKALYPEDFDETFVVDWVAKEKIKEKMQLLSSLQLPNKLPSPIKAYSQMDGPEPLVEVKLNIPHIQQMQAIELRPVNDACIDIPSLRIDKQQLTSKPGDPSISFILGRRWLPIQCNQLNINVVSVHLDKFYKDDDNGKRVGWKHYRFEPAYVIQWDTSLLEEKPKIDLRSTDTYFRMHPKSTLKKPIPILSLKVQGVQTMKYAQVSFMVEGPNGELRIYNSKAEVKDGIIMLDQLNGFGHALQTGTYFVDQLKVRFSADANFSTGSTVLIEPEVTKTVFYYEGTGSMDDAKK